uniref:glycosylated lysosomal membrane protein A-like n=1 Tax=Myxine glutinosa TaxID=7769 RepID=UPI00358E8693
MAFFCSSSPQITLEVNPGCKHNYGHTNLVHLRAAGPHDTLHYVWSTIGVPTLLIIHSLSNESKLVVNWASSCGFSNQTPEAITVHPEKDVDISMALALTKLFEFYDANTTGNLTTATRVFPPYLLEDFWWDDVTHMVNFWTHAARFCGHLKNASLNITILSTTLRNEDSQTYIQWKPVSYNKCWKNREASVPCKYYGGSSPDKQQEPNRTIAYIFYKGVPSHVHAFNISFGIGKEDFYNVTRFISWTALVGFGKPPLESISDRIFVFVCLGLPALFLLLSIVSALWHRKHWHGNLPTVETH